MSISARIRREKLLSAAEGFVDLEMGQQALEALGEIDQPEEAAFTVHYLRGMALRQLGRHAEALLCLEQAREINAEHVGLLMALAWCYKRTDRLDLAIAATEQAYRLEPKTGILLYNMACYYALAGNTTQALSWLGRALRLDANCRALIADEHDFDTIRHHPDFQLMVQLAQNLAEIE